MDSRHGSFFTYSITRPFPFRWLTPVAVVGGIVLAALVSFWNFAANGYILTVELSNDPNATISQSLESIQHWPSYLTSKIRPSCQPASLPVNTQFFTNQTALVYTLTDVWQEEPKHTVLPALPYHGNVLEKCTVNSIQIDVESQDRAANQLALTEWGARVRTLVTCKITIDTGAVFFNLTQSYDYVPDTVTFAQINTFLGSGILSRDNSSRASLWWGESLMSTYWVQMTKQLQDITRDTTDPKWYAIRKGSLYFVPQADKAIEHIDFFSFFRAQMIKATEPGFYEYPEDIAKDMMTIGDVIRNEEFPNIWSSAERLAKSTYATVLNDLGQILTEPIMLTDPTLLKFFTSDIASIQIQDHRANARPGPAKEGYDETHNTGPLSVTQSVISTQYLCQIPRLRSTGSLAMAILVADLVILQTAWQLYMLLCGFILTRKTSDAHWCIGCLKGLPPTASVSVMEKTSDGKYERVSQREIEIEAA